MTKAGLEGQTWLITGASAGIGRALGEAVIARGGNLVATARNPANLDGLVALAPDRVLATRLDVTDQAQIDEALAAAEARFGQVDVVVNNAGFGFLAAIEEASDAEVRTLFDANVFGLAAVTRSVLPAMRKRGAGRIINISSMSGFRASPGVGYYAASKWAVEAMSEALAKEVALLGIGVLIVEPGPFRTDFAGRSLLRPANEIADYTVANQIRAGSQKGSGNEPGDPVRAAEQIIDTALAGTQLRLVVGQMGYDGIIGALDERKQSVELSRELAGQADFPVGT